MTDHEDETSLGNFVFDDKNQENKSWSSLRQTCSRSLTVFLSQLFVNLVDYLWLILENSSFKKSVTNQFFRLDFCVVEQGTVYTHQDYEQSSFIKKSCHRILGCSV